MMLTIKGINGESAGKKSLPAQFETPVNTDIIRRAVLSLQANRRQQYGAAPMAGKRASAVLSRRRRDYRGSYGIGISRVPRKIMSHRGTRFNWVGAFAPGTVGGRRAHPPKGSKVWEQKINKKENRKAICSALAASMNPELAKKRGHKLPEGYPFLVSNDFEAVSKTKSFRAALLKLGFAAELARAQNPKIRAGKGKMRGRKYQQKKSLLVLVSKDCQLLKAARNIPGLDVAKVNEANAELLAPGTHPGRALLLTEAAVDRLAVEKLFM